jgi:hypothetical protein
MEACPKGISVDFIARLNRDYIKASAAKGRRPEGNDGGAG